MRILLSPGFPEHFPADFSTGPPGSDRHNNRMSHTHPTSSPDAFDEYQRKTSVFAAYPRETALSYVGLGLSGEAGEVANQLKKIVRDDGGKVTPQRRASLIDELGDVLWYCAALARELELPLSEVARLNIEKLSKRHGKTPV